MSDYNSSKMMYLAPGASSGVALAPGIGGAARALYLPGPMQPAKFPAVDDRVVEPETGTEMIDGRVMQVLPAEPPHSDEQCSIGAVLKVDVADGYVASTELLTRVDGESDFATDVCVRRAGRDPETGSRYLEELSFEVQHKQSEADLRTRARKLVRRGVRRVFSIKVWEDGEGTMQAGPVREWLAGEERWQELGPEDEIADRCLFQPLKVQALLDATAAEVQMAVVFVAKKHPVVEEYKDKALEEQKKELDEAHARALEAQAREAIVDLCDALEIEVTDGRRARLEAMTGDELGELRRAIRAERSWPEDA